MLNLIDLAGSERLSKSLAQGDRLKETQAINKSLSALGDLLLSAAYIPTCRAAAANFTHLSVHSLLMCCTLTPTAQGAA